MWSSEVRVLDLDPTSGRMSPLTPLKPLEMVSNLGPIGPISSFDCRETKVRGSAVRVLYLGSTSGWCQRAVQGVSSNAFYV